MCISAEGIALLKRFEGCRLTAYEDVVGVWTIGYGHTKQVTNGDCISQEEAERRLVEDDLPVYERAVTDAVSGPIGSIPEITQNQFDAMVCLCYNIGVGGFTKSSVVRKLWLGDVMGAADAFLLWNKAAGKVVPGLSNRRKAERDLFLRTA